MLRLVPLLIFFVILSLPSSLLARPLVAEISSHDITIHTSFDGTELILFGVRNDPGDIIVVVRGPDRKATVRKKERVYGIWMNRQTEYFGHIPAFYAMAASRDYEDITQSIYLDALQIGYLEAIERLRLKSSAFINEEERARREMFARALLRELRTSRLYKTSVDEITFVGGGLFRTSIFFPDNTPTGTYTVEVYLLSDGEITGMHTTPIYVYKSGLDAFIYDMAHDYPAAYGVAAIMIALAGGLLAIQYFNRR